ncbi:hypothetical protein TYRP_018140 [Tyrophagus putrescentiae]|nr:hypothetical protein TYRP_018140 [Tyrophagus putrescentiae]
MVITVNFNSGGGALKTDGSWEDFLRSFNRHLEKIDAARKHLAEQEPAGQVDALVASNAQLAESLEAEHRRIVRTILSESDIEFEPNASTLAEDGAETSEEGAVQEEFMPSVEQIEAKTGELMEELEALKRDCRAKKVQLEAVTGEREALAARYGQVKRERQEYLNKMLA